MAISFDKKMRLRHGTAEGFAGTDGQSARQKRPA